MISNNKEFISFPLSGTQTITVGISRLDFILGKAELSDGSIIPIGHRSTQVKSLRSIFFNNDIDINVEINFRNKIVFTGLIPAGHFTIKNISYDLILITASASTELSIIGSYTIDCIESEMVSSTSLSKTDGIEILAHQGITHPSSVVGSAIDVSTKSEITLVLFHGVVENVSNTNPGVFLIQMSGSPDGNEDWATLYTFTATASLADSEAITAIEPIGEKVLNVSSTSGFDELDVLYIQDTGTLIDSEWALCQRVVGGVSIDLIDGLTNAKDSSDVIRNDAKVWTRQIDLTTVTRIRVLFVHEGFAGADCHIKALGITRNM